MYRHDFNRVLVWEDGRFVETWEAPEGYVMVPVFFPDKTLHECLSALLGLSESHSTVVKDIRHADQH